MKDQEVMQRLLDTAAEAMQAGLRHARSEDPHVYLELAAMLGRGLHKPELVITFQPEPTVTFRLVGDVMQEETDRPAVLEVFSYGGALGAESLGQIKH